MNPSVVARSLHTPFLILAAWVAGGLIALAGAFIWAELAARRPQVGGQYAYLRESLHPILGFLYGWVVLLVIVSGGMAASAITFASYFVDMTGLAIPESGLAVLALAGLTVINCLGVRTAGTAQNVFMILKVLAIVVFLVVGLGLIAAVLVASLWIGGSLVDLDVGLGYLVAAATSQLMLGISFGAVALSIGCLTGRRGLSRGLTSALAVAMFLVSSLAPLADWLEPYREVSPMYHALATEPLRNGLGLANVAYLIAIAAVFFAGSLVAFNRRDLAT